MPDKSQASGALSVTLVEPVQLTGGPELDLLARLLQRAVRPATSIESIPADIDWDAFLRIAQDNRLLLVAARGLQDSGLATPERVLKTIARYRALTVSLIGANFVTLRAVIEAFSAAHIHVINLKGPVALSALHGDPFIRPSTDIDLLVRRRDFKRAGEVLEANGFLTPRGADTLWWRTFLGEQHYYAEGRAPIDLHHRIQQPGCPAPRSLEAFWTDRIHASVGKVQTPVLSPTHACLLSCVSLAKAIANREPAGAHAWDIGAYLAASCPNQQAALNEAARSMGLLNTLRLGLRAARAIFGITVVGMAVENAMPFADDEEIAAIVLAPDAAPVVKSHRTRLLVSLSDSSVELAKNIGWAVAARAARLTTPRRKVVERGWAGQLAGKS
jgi:hypothetical protein